jgi:hypothetical protein
MTPWHTRLLELGWLLALVTAIVTAFERLPFLHAYAVCLALLGVTVALLGKRQR